MPPTEAPATAAGTAQITPEDFARIDLRVARVETAEFVEGADRLLKLGVDLGGERRTVFAGIRGAYEPAALVGRHVVIVANLKPKKMRFGTSEGMALAASGDEGLFLLSPDAGATGRHESQLRPACPPRTNSTGRIDALLPQTQCRRCGFEACRPYAEALARGETELNRCPPGGAALITKLAVASRPARALPLDPACGSERPPLRRVDRRAGLHRLRALPAALPDRRDRRRPQAHAHRDRCRLQRLRTLRAGLPGRLHPHGAGAGACRPNRCRRPWSRNARCTFARSTNRVASGCRAPMAASRASRKAKSAKAAAARAGATRPGRGPAAVRAPACREPEPAHRTRLRVALPAARLRHPLRPGNGQERQPRDRAAVSRRADAGRRSPRSARPDSPATSAPSACGA